MALTIQSIRSFLANQNVTPSFQNSGVNLAASEAGKVQDTVNFSAQGTKRAATDMELFRARFAATQETLPARQDSAVLEANRTTFNLFRNAIEKFRETENQTNTDLSIAPAPPATLRENATGADELAGIVIPATAPRQAEPLPSRAPLFGATVTEPKRSAVDTPFQNIQPENRPQPAEEPVSQVFTPLALRQPDTDFTAGFRDRNEGGPLPRNLSNRIREDAPTAADRRDTPAGTTAFAPLPPTPGIPASREGRGQEEEQDLYGRLSPPGRDSGRAPLATNAQPARPLAAPADASVRGEAVGLANPTQQPERLPPRVATVQENGTIVAGDTTRRTPAATAPGAPRPVAENSEEENVPFAFANGFRGRPGEPNPTTLPQPAPLNFPSRVTVENGRATNGATPINAPPPAPEPATANRPVRQPETTNPNPTVIPINRNAALSLYARLGGFGRDVDISQGPEESRLSLVA